MTKMPYMMTTVITAKKMKRMTPTVMLRVAAMSLSGTAAM